MAGPLNGHPLASPYATRSRGILDAFGRPIVLTDDPAWQPKKDPLKNPRAAASVINREIPITTTGTSWDVAMVRGALAALVIGLFDEPAQLVDAIVGDSRVQAALSSRTGGLLGRQVDFAVPKGDLGDSDEAKECRDAFEASWEQIGGERVFSEVERWSMCLGFCPGQLIWDFDSGSYAVPHLEVWHPRYTYFHWLYRRFIAITLDGQFPIEPGDAHWFLHAPNGEYRGWMHGAVRAIGPWWLARQFALRDWARYSERHGMPIVKAMHPAEGDPVQNERYRNDLSNLGQESVVSLPQGTSDQQGTSYDIDYLETKDQAWQGFKELISKCDAEITLSLMSQNLTTEVKEGSFAAARVHADVRQSLLEADARSLGWTIYTQIARPFAAINFGNADLAPRVSWDVKPYEDDLTAAQTFLAFAQGVSALLTAGRSIDNMEAFARKFGLDLGAAKFVDVAPPTKGTP